MICAAGGPGKAKRSHCPTCARRLPAGVTRPELGSGTAPAAANVRGAVAVASRATWTLRALDALLSFAAGFLISVSVVDLFPESIAVAGPIAPVIVLLAYLL